MYYVLVIVLSLLVIYYIDNRFNNNLFIKDVKNINVKEMLLCSFSFVIIVMLLYLLFNYFGLITITKLKSVFILRYFLSIVLTPIVEEYIFRYLPCKLINRKVMVIIIGSVLFTTLHNVTFYESIIVFVASILLYLMYVKTNRISNSIVSHGLWNLCIIILSMV